MISAPFGILRPTGQSTLSLPAGLGLRWPSYVVGPRTLVWTLCSGEGGTEVCCCYGLLLLMEGAQALVSTGTSLEPSIGASGSNVPAPG